MQEAKQRQSELDTLSLPATPEGAEPQLLLESGRFRAYRFVISEDDDWVYDTGSGRIDAALERYFMRVDPVS